jgi:hypothetical protein
MSTTPEPTEPATTACLELAIYSVQADAAAAFPAQQAAMHAVLHTVPGFVSAQRLRGLDDPTLFADCIQWASQADAEAAAAQLPTLAGGAEFMAAIAVMHTFAHLPVMVRAGGDGP